MTRIDWWRVLGALSVVASGVVMALALWAFCVLVIAVVPGPGQ